MKNPENDEFSSVLSYRVLQRVAIIGAGVAGLSCARELRQRGFHPVVFEAGDRVGGRCSSRITRTGCFDDGAQAISGDTRLSAYAAQRPGELSALHEWTVAATPAEDEPKGRDRDKELDEEASSRSLKPLGLVGVPSMLALAGAIARPLDTRLRMPIANAWRRGARWVLQGAAGDIDEDFQALVLAAPAPAVLPLALQSHRLSQALRAVRFSSRWVLLLGCERPVGLPGYREFQGSPIARVAAMHSKPGRSPAAPQRWFVEADQRWSSQHQQDDAETVAESLHDIFRAHVGRRVLPNCLLAHQWRNAYVQTPATLPGQADGLWDDDARLGVCGDSVVTSRVDQVHRSGVALATRVADGLTSPRARSFIQGLGRGLHDTAPAQAVHG